MPFPAPLRTEPFDVKTQDGVTLKGRRFPNEGGIKFVLLHGFSETWYIFSYLASALQKMGYDVYAFNLRGHGNGDDRSVHPDYSPFELNQNRMYGFSRMLTYDLPAIRARVGKGPVVILGHSKGGNVARYANTGVRVDGDSSEVIPLKAEEKFDLAFPLGSPLHFNFDLMTFQAWSKSPLALSETLNAIAISNRNPREDGSVFPIDPLGLLSLCSEAAHRCIGSLFFKGLIETENLQTRHRDVAHIFEHGVSRPPRDFVEDIRFWGANGFVLPDGTQLRGLPYPEPQNLIQIVGSRDALASREDALREARERKQKATVWTLGEYGHIDLVYGKKSSEALAVKLDRKIRSVLGPNPSVCANLIQLP